MQAAISRFAQQIVNSRLIASPDEARCYFQPVLADGARVGQTSLNQIRLAGELLRDKCGFFRGQGGRAYNIGK